MTNARMNAGRAIAYALIGTALIAYLHTIAYALGATNPKQISPFFLPQDLFADFFKLLHSFPFASPLPLEPWLPVTWRKIIEGYLQANPYSSDASKAPFSLTNYHLPPVQIVFAALFGWLCKALGGGTTFTITVLGLFTCLASLVRLSGFKKHILLITTACFMLYPSLYALTRGHVLAYITALCLGGSFLLALQPKPRPWLPALLLAVAINIRPNNIFYLPLLASQLSRAGKTSRLVATIAGATTLLLISCSAAAQRIYPAYSGSVFLQAYSFYSKAYEFGDAGKDYNSAPLQAAVMSLKYLLSRLDLSYSIQTSSLVRVGLLVLGATLCLFSWRLFSKRWIGLPKSILLCTLGMIIAVPVFADYHLLAFLTPLLCSKFMEAQLEGGACDAGSILTKPMSNLDYWLFIALILPKTFPLPIAPHITAQTFLNPLLVFVYLVTAAWQHRAARRHLLARI